MIDKRILEANFRKSIDSDSSINRKKKRELRKQIERPLMLFLQYLFGDPSIYIEDLDLKGERFTYTPVNSKGRKAYRTFEKLWGKFLLAEGIVDEKVETKKPLATNEELETLPTLSEIDVMKEIPSREKFKALNNEKRVGVTSHAQYKVFRTLHLMDELGIATREIKEADYKAETTTEEQAAIESLGRRIYAESELIKVGNSNGREGMFRYYYHSKHNLIIILPEDEEQIVTIYKAYIDKSMAEEILLEKRRSEEIHSATLRETQISYRRVEELLDYRKRQVEKLEKQKEALGRSIGAIEESFGLNERDLDRIINERKFSIKNNFFSFEDVINS